LERKMSWERIREEDELGEDKKKDELGKHEK
jgi:hypothetical protein